MKTSELAKKIDKTQENLKSTVADTLTDIQKQMKTMMEIIEKN